MTAELSRAATTRPFRNVQRDAVGGPPPLIGESIALFGRELLDPGTGLDRDTSRELPRSKVPVVRHGPTKMRTSRRKPGDRKSTRLNSSHLVISYAVFCLKKKKKTCMTARV